MRRNIFLTIMVSVALMMSSCSGDMYDNIKELVDSETVYPAGYDQRNESVALKSGFERIEIYLCEPGVTDTNVYLPKAKKTVVEYGDTTVKFEPARSWVNITGLTVPQTYHFKIYTEDEHGNVSPPVEYSGRPFTELDRSSWIITGISYLSKASYAYIQPVLSPAVYDITDIEYSFHDGSKVRMGMQAGNVLCLDSLPDSQSFHVNLTFHLLPIGAIDRVTSTAELDIETTSQTDFDVYMNLTAPFCARDIDITKDATYLINAADFDLGGYNVAYWRGNDSYGETDGLNDKTYRNNAGCDVVKNYGVHTNSYSAGLAGVAWTSNGAWYEYTVNVVDPGIYRMEYNNARQGAANANLLIDNNNILGTFNVIESGNWGNFMWVNHPPLYMKLPSGMHKLRWHMVQEHNLGGFRFTYVEPLK